jgi:hypothetical protein
LSYVVSRLLAVTMMSPSGRTGAAGRARCGRRGAAGGAGRSRQPCAPTGSARAPARTAIAAIAALTDSRLRSAGTARAHSAASGTTMLTRLPAERGRLLPDGAGGQVDRQRGGADGG